MAPEGTGAEAPAGRAAGGADFSVRQTWVPLAGPQSPHLLNGDDHHDSQCVVRTRYGHVHTAPGDSRCPQMFSHFLCLSPSVGQVGVIPTIVRRGLTGDGGE